MIFRFCGYVELPSHRNWCPASRLLADSSRAFAWAAIGEVRPPSARALPFILRLPWLEFHRDAIRQSPSTLRNTFALIASPDNLSCHTFASPNHADINIGWQQHLQRRQQQFSQPTQTPSHPTVGSRRWTQERGIQAQVGQVEQGI